MRIGKLRERPNFTFSPSPDSRYGYTLLHSSPGLTYSVCLFDLTRRTVDQFNTPNWTCGWWDNTRLLFSSTNHDFILQDVVTRQTTPLIQASQLAEFFRQNRLSDDPAKAQAFYNWNGRDYDFYLTDTHQKWLAAESFLIKIERPSGALKLLAPRFKFEWSDHFDATGRYYLYTGRESGQDSDAVFLRDLTTATNRVLVPGESQQYFSIPRFYRDSVIYVRSNALWRINLDGSNNSRLLP